MDFKSYGSHWGWDDVAFFSVIGILSFLLLAFIVAGYNATTRQMEEHKAFKEKCIDAGGHPVSPFEYVKGYGYGYLCINPSAIIQLKD